MFKKIELEDLKQIRSFLLQSNQKACEFSAGNNILWDFNKELEFAILREQLVYRMIDDVYIGFFIPDMQKDSRELIESLRKMAQDESKKMYLGIMTHEMAQNVESLFPNTFKISFDRDHSDYLYQVQDMAQLKGKKFHRKKNHLNSFMKNYEFVYEKIEASNIEECRKMKNRWLVEKEEKTESMLLEAGAVDVALDHYQEFDFLGGLIRIDGVVEAFTFGERLNQDTFLIHVEKASDRFRGLYTAISQQFALYELAEYTFVNREEDMGIEGLRQSKLSFYPIEIYDKYYAYEI